MSFSRRPQKPNSNIASKDYPQINLREIVALLEATAVRIKFWKAVQCPCLNFQTGQPNISCNQCRGLGWSHTPAEVAPEYQKAQVHSRSARKETVKGGTITTGGVAVTFLPKVIPAEGDLIQVCSDRDVVNDEVHIVGSALLNGDSAERLRFKDIIEVESVYIYNEISNTTVLLDKTKWKFNPDLGRIEFLASQPVGTRYSVRYHAVPEYVIMGNSVKPIGRVGHDDSEPKPLNSVVEKIYPYFAQAIRLDRATLMRQRGSSDNAAPNTFNKFKQGPFV